MGQLTMSAAQEDILQGLNANRGSLQALHAEFASAFPGAMATEVILLGITSGTSAENIATALAQAAPNTVTANVTGMGVAQVQALATGAAKLKNDGVTGTFGFALTSAITNWQALLPKVNAQALLNIDAEGMGAADLNVVAANAVRVDSVVNAAITSGNSVVQIGLLMGRATDGSMSVIADEMDDARLNAVVTGGLAKLKANGITGIAVLTNGLTDLDGILAACAAGATTAAGALLASRATA
jgi:hypothetical protein